MAAGGRILLADDSANDVELALAALGECDLAASVDVVRDGAEAWDYLQRTGAYQGRQGDPVVVVLDVKMPKLDGIEVLRRMRSTEELRAMPAVMLTSSREERDIVASYGLGVNAYVVKPVAFESFREVVGLLGRFWGLVNEPPPSARSGGRA